MRSHSNFESESRSSAGFSEPAEAGTPYGHQLSAAPFQIRSAPESPLRSATALQNAFVSFLVTVLFAACFSDAMAQTVTRGPYLQQGTPTTIIVRWRTSAATATRVRYGTSPDDFSGTNSDATATSEHIIGISGLQPSTRYYYEIGTSTDWFTGDPGDFFDTAPPAGSRAPTRIWVIGDSGFPTTNAIAVRDAYLNFTGSRQTDLWLMLGDNAYDSGTDAEYQAAVFNMYPALLQNAPVWSTRGNHEVDASNTGSTYYNIFSFPTRGEAGGVASGTEAYYSFDYANVHFICLDSFGSSRSGTGVMADWLRADLSAVSTGSDWIVTFFHHPPYSRGSHNSDSETELVQMRQNILPILEDAGVDLVLSGHSHSYERSFLLDGHYGTAASLTSAMIKNGGSGRENSGGAYQKSAPGGAHEGAVYAVAGSSSALSGGALDHPAMFISLNQLGSLVLDVNGNRLDAKFLRENGSIGDSFTIIKGLASVPAAPYNLTAAAGETHVTLRWAGSYGWTWSG